MPSVINDCQTIAVTAPSGLLIEASIANDKVLEQFYRDYDAAFVLANEKEGYTGFKECLELNSGEAYRQAMQRYGVFREFVLVVHDPESGKRIGGANFIAFPLKVAAQADKTVLSINLNYIFINQDVRNRGYFTQLIRDFPEIAFRLLVTTSQFDVPGTWRSDDFHADAERPQTLIFVEQNDPFVMSAEDYRLDTQYTGLDQLDRIGIWTRLGAKIIDFPYVQPPLTSEQGAAHNLVLAVLGMTADTIDPCLLHDHLERFFGVSVLKGTEVLTNPAAAQQLSVLRDACAHGKTIELLTARSLTKPEVAGSGMRPGSLREALRN